LLEKIKANRLAMERIGVEVEKVRSSLLEWMVDTLIGIFVLRKCFLEKN